MPPSLEQVIRACGVCVALTAACASPPPPAPSATQVAGAWIANAALTSAVGGECVGADLQAAAGRRDRYLVALAGESSLAATITSEGNGTSCAYSGPNAGGALTLTMTTCRLSQVPNVLCGNGSRRDLQLVGGTLQGTASSLTGTGSGTDVTTWNVLAAGSTQVLGTLTLRATFTWVYLGLPSADYHEFTGSVFPGYADGTITIPADANPWCSPCGWFH